MRALRGRVGVESAYQRSVRRGGGFGGLRVRMASRTLLAEAPLLADRPWRGRAPESFDRLKPGGIRGRRMTKPLALLCTARFSATDSECPFCRIITKNNALASKIFV